MYTSTLGIKDIGTLTEATMRVSDTCLVTGHPRDGLEWPASEEAKLKELRKELHRLYKARAARRRGETE